MADPIDPINAPPTIRQQLNYVRQLEYLSVGQCSLLLGVHTNTIRRWLPQLAATDVVRHGRTVRVRRVALLQYRKTGSL